jgi:hypothetical protein
MANTKRIAVWTVSVVAGAIVLLIGREIYLAATATPNVTVDYSTFVNGRVREANAGFAKPKADFARFEQLLLSIADADQRSARLAQPDEKEPAVEYGLLFAPIKEEETARRELARQCMADHVASGRMSDLAELPGLVGVSRELAGGKPIMTTLLPELSPARQTARLLNARLVLALRERREDDAMAAMEQIIALGTVLTHQATLIDRLVGIAIHSMVLGTIRDEHAAGNIDANLAARMLRALDQCDERPAPTLQLDTERDSALDIVQRTHTADGRFIPEAYNKLLGPGGLGPTSNMMSAFMPRREETERAIIQRYEETFEQAKLPRAVRDFSKIDTSVMNERRGFDLSRMLMSSMGRYFSSEDQFLTTLHGVQILLGLEVHREKTGAYPQSLSELTPVVFPTLPIDMVAKDQQFRYRLRPEGVTSGRPFLLYSIGVDQTDNDANEHAKLDTTAFNPNSTANGYDFVVNRKPPEEAVADPK